MVHTKKHFTLGIFEEDPILKNISEKLVALCSSQHIQLAVHFLQATPSLNLLAKDLDLVLLNFSSLSTLDPTEIKRLQKQPAIFAYSKLEPSRLLRIIQSVLDSKINKPSPSSHPYHEAIALTQAEKQILPWLLEGLSSKEIGEKLFISVNTVNFHRKNLFKKFGVHNIAAFVKEALLEVYLAGIQQNRSKYHLFR